MMPVNKELTPLFLSHEDLEPQLEDLGSLCATLELDPDNADAKQALDSAWRDLQPRLFDHMRAEEKWAFPAAIAAGAPRPLVTALMGMHQRLRHAASRCATADVADPVKVSRFLRHFGTHVEYEERSLAHFYGRGC